MGTASRLSMPDGRKNCGVERSRRRDEASAPPAFGRIRSKPLTAEGLRSIIGLMKTADFDRIIDAALQEDLAEGDITSESIVPPGSTSRAEILAKQDGILAGIGVARRVFEKVDPDISFREVRADGVAFGKGDVLARLGGRSVSLLKGERTALNFLQRMSGIATATRAYVDAVRGTKARILDTRKTTPGLRVLEKYAVRMGGGENHRFSLSDGVLIKDNHLSLAGGVAGALKRARARMGPAVKMEVEVTDFAGAREALENGADRIMLDNMPPALIGEVVDWVAGRALIEVSGGVGLENVGDIARLGVDYISVGALTHSYKSLDLSLEFTE